MPTPLPVASRAVPRCLRSQPKAQPVLRQNIWHKPQNASDLIGGVSKSGDRYVDHTMFDMVQSLTIADSLKFGKAVLNKLGKINKLHKNQVEQAGFAVLKAPDIPSILVETAFISNVEEERKLKTATFQQEVAESILAGIKAYFADGATLARRG